MLPWILDIVDTGFSPGVRRMMGQVGGKEAFERVGAVRYWCQAPICIKLLAFFQQFLEALDEKQGLGRLGQVHQKALAVRSDVIGR